MARKITSFLPQLSIAVPIATTGLLIFQEIPDPITSLLSKTADEQKEEGEKSKEGKEGAKGNKKDEADGKGGKGQGKQDGKGDLVYTVKKGDMGAQGAGGSGEGKGQDSEDGPKEPVADEGTPRSSGTDIVNVLGSEGLPSGDTLGNLQGLLNNLSSLTQGSSEGGQNNIQGQEAGDQEEGKQGDRTQDSAGNDNGSGDANQVQNDPSNSAVVGSGSDEDRRETTGIPSSGSRRVWASAFSGFWDGDLTEEFID
ncbi:hypothetical protein A6V39_01115 [Candidatus Mycoplasma haematobovis]|uniref:Uncharacterized protein n=1 Tax=Candidatus Mycoplasma haematobovis TaxID=432608 RepID=A0A1A9QDV7_9MOLU|nr:hypothetical protein [Candidatus Mycoplasma haematobovis]OAL10653.1 hypothetical protein A6V39_01115 [Candidatus Mycoplasma haematobovis]